MNYQTLYSKVGKFLVGALLLSAPVLNAEEVRERTPPVSDGRVFTQEEKIDHQEHRARMLEMFENGEDLSEVEGVNIKEVEALNRDVLKDENLKAVSGHQFALKGFNAATYVTSHEGAIHRPYAVSLLGDIVELEDGSIWAVKSGDRYKTFDWLTGDAIIIVPNHSLFSLYSYNLINLNTGAKVAVNLSLAPIYNGIYTHWIVAINYFHGEICLEDGSVWQMSSLDSNITNKWLPNDTVIIGINDGWFSGINPNILINATIEGRPYAMGNCIW